MASAPGHLGRFARRAKERPLLLGVGLACAAAVLLEVAALSGFFGVGALLHRSSGPGLPDLNPYHDTVIAVTANVSYIGAISGYFPSLEGTSLCGRACPITPRIWTPKEGNLSPEVGVYFYFNVTNTATVDVNLSVPVLTTSGPDADLFFLQTFCCFSKVGVLYDEDIDTGIAFTPGFTFGLEGYAYTTVPLPSAPGGGFTLSLAYTSD